MWSIAQGPTSYELSDGVAHRWLLDREDGEQRVVRVEISGTALVSSDLPSPLPEVIETKGAQAVAGFVNWTEPPRVVHVTTVSINPFPGSPDPAS